VAAIAAVGDDAREVGADLRLDLRDHGRKGATVPRVKPRAGSGLPGVALQWAMNWPPSERSSVVASETAPSLGKKQECFSKRDTERYAAMRCRGDLTTNGAKNKGVYDQTVAHTISDASAVFEPG
jgi:hypothetical protein